MMSFFVSRLDCGKPFKIIDVILMVDGVLEKL